MINGDFFFSNTYIIGWRKESSEKNASNYLYEIYNNNNSNKINK